MIVVYPLFISKNISKDNSVLIAKSLELYIASIVYGNANNFANFVKRVGTEVGIGIVADRIGKYAGDAAGEVVRGVGRKIFEHNEEDDNISLDGLVNVNISEISNDLISVYTEADKKDRAKKIGFSAPNRGDLTPEPTFIKYGSNVVGVKVVPMYIENDQAFYDHIKHDTQLKSLRMFYNVVSRKIKSTLHNMTKFFSKSKVEGDPGEFIFSSSKFGHNVFLCLDYNEFKQNAIDPDNGDFSKLFTLGYKSMILADEVNKRVFFCMREYKGLCSIIPYSYMSSSLGKYDVYKNMDAVKSTASAFFQIRRKPLNKIVAESMVDDVFTKFGLESNKYNNDIDLSLMEDKHDILEYDNFDYLEEGFTDFFKTKANPISFIKSVKQSLMAKNKNDVDHKMLSVKDMDSDAIKSEMKQNKEFDKVYKYSLKVIDNSVRDLSPEMKDSLATGVAYRAIEKEGDSMRNTKSEIKTVINTVMKYSGKSLIALAMSVLWLWVTDYWIFPQPVRVAGVLIIIGRALYKIAKREDREDRQRTREELGM